MFIDLTAVPLTGGEYQNIFVNVHNIAYVSDLSNYVDKVVAGATIVFNCAADDGTMTRYVAERYDVVMQLISEALK